MDFICKTCGKSYKFQSSLSRHGRIHKALRVVCNCGISFSRQDSLRRHQFLSIACRALENAEENVHNTLPATPTIQNENLTDKQHSQTSDDMRWYEAQPETVRIKHYQKSKQNEISLEPRRKHSEISEKSESSPGPEVKRKHHETSDGSSDDDSSDDDVPIRRKYKASEPIISRKPKRILRRKHKVRGWRKKFHHRKLKIVPQLPPTNGLLNAIQRAADNSRYRASQVSLSQPNFYKPRPMNPYKKGVGLFSQF